MQLRPERAGSTMTYLRLLPPPLGLLRAAPSGRTRVFFFFILAHDTRRVVKSSSSLIDWQENFCIGQPVAASAPDAAGGG